MNRSFICDFIRQHTLAVISTMADDGRPQAALVGIAVSDELEIIFDTVKTSRKYANILHNPQVALVIGWDNEMTLQYEGTATELYGPGAEKYKEIYFAAFPGGRERAETWPGLVHFKISPKWIRYSNFNDPETIDEIIF